MRAVAAGAVGRGSIPADEEGLPVHALQILPVLRNRQPVALHQTRIRVARGTGDWDAHRVDRRLRILLRSNTMSTVATCANGDVCIPAPQMLAVLARQVLGVLVG